jgi:hypothetical protein
MSRDNSLNDFSEMEWCPEPELNQRHADFQSAALPTELSGHLGAFYRQDVKVCLALSQQKTPAPSTGFFCQANLTAPRRQRWKALSFRAFRPKPSHCEGEWHSPCLISANT